MHPETNILIGINGSGKSNFLKAIRLLYEGVAGKGLKAFVFENLGGFDNAFFKGIESANLNIIEITYVFDSTKLHIFTGNKEHHHLHSELKYTIRLIKLPNQHNYYVKEDLEAEEPEQNIDLLNFINGNGHLSEKKSNSLERHVYKDFDPQELALGEVNDSERFPILSNLRKAIKDILVYDYFDTTPNSPIRKANVVASAKRLNADGSNLAQVLNTIKNTNKHAYSEIIKMLTEVNPAFVGFDYNFIGGSASIELMLEEKGLNSSVHVSSISDGTLRYLCLLAILYNPDRGKFICIDEPESGLHPDMILNIANAIKYASKDTTMLISTHSVSLLDCFGIGNLIIFEKDEKNATRAINYNEDDFKGWYDDFVLGKMWVAGNLGGVRYGA